MEERHFLAQIVAQHCVRVYAVNLLLCHNLKIKISVSVKKIKPKCALSMLYSPYLLLKNLL